MDMIYSGAGGLVAGLAWVFLRSYVKARQAGMGVMDAAKQAGGVVVNGGGGSGPPPK